MDAAIIVTYRCNARCRMCDTWRFPTKSAEEFSPELLKKLPGGLGRVNITGGEPALRADLPEIVEVLAPKSARLEISTNGYFTDRLVEAAKWDPHITVRVSVEGLPETNDRIRGIENGFDHAMRSYLHLREAGVKDLGFAVTIQDANKDDLIDLYRLVDHLGAEFAQAVPHNSYYFHKYDNEIEDKEGVRSAIVSLIEAFLRSKRPKQWFRAYLNRGLADHVVGRTRRLDCTAGTDIFFLDPSGEVYPCNGREWSMGNLHESSFDELWNGEKARLVREQVRSCDAGCWMTGTAVPAMRRKLPSVVWWVLRNRCASCEASPWIWPTDVRIAHIGGKGLPSKGGTERVIEALAISQARSHDVTVYGSARACSSCDYRGVRVIAVRVPRNKYLGPVWLDISSTLRALTSPRYDIVHVHGAENAFTVPLLKLRSRVVTTNHGPTHERGKWGRAASALIRWAERGSVTSPHAATAVSQAQAADLSERYGVRVRYIPNGVDSDAATDAAAAAKVLAEVGLQPGGYALFAAARVDPTKGCLTLIRAWRILDCPMPLLVVGDLWHAPGHEAELREAAAGMDVRFIPRVEEKETLAGLVTSADVFVFPSTVEAMSMMLLEVMQLGTPVLASDIVENTQILPDGAWQFVAGDPEDLARAYRDLAAEPEQEVRDRCRRRAEAVGERYSWDNIAGEYESVYLGVLGRSSDAGASPPAM